ncbi:hypothetical protein [Haloterrigena salifodinae]|uniref:hypothetical protein n=1 Tax=Haloterrigena salifodinae TaxID=2675099 RepID=UPI0013DF2A46|nr:hypothetical protein [Haloterrigena salifodinae]
MAETLTAFGWVVMLSMIITLWCASLVALRKTLSEEDKKAELITRQGAIESYSPRALFELREWIENHPNDPYREIAVQRYNECVETLKKTDESFYDWNDSQISNLERL